jgi:hypothetical protein
VSKDVARSCPNISRTWAAVRGVELDFLPGVSPLVILLPAAMKPISPSPDVRPPRMSDTDGLYVVVITFIIEKLGGKLVARGHHCCPVK